MLKKWEGTPFAHLKLSLNVFPEDFDYLDVPDTLCSLADMYGVPRNKINVEITESAIISRSALRQRGGQTAWWMPGLDWKSMISERGIRR